tara:strand:+ start:131 stop:706 length:576 start_codon:yes stop_codon:yes gene_type:complete
MKGVTDFDLCYDRVFYAMWDATTGQAVGWRECYRGAKHFGRFCLSELDRKEELERAGETALARRGLVASDSIFKAWVFNIIEDCTYMRAPLPPEMLNVIYCLFGCSHLQRRDEDIEMHRKRSRFEAQRRQHPNLPTRQTARDLNVDAATIVRWKKLRAIEPGVPTPESRQAIFQRTNVMEFAKRASEALRR